MTILTSDRENLISKIQEFTQSLYIDGVNISNQFKVFTEEQIKIMKSFGYSTESSDIISISQKMKEIKKSLEVLPTLMITLAFDPSVKFTEYLKGFISSKIKEHIVLSIKINSEIYGGIIVEQNGKYKDHSIKNVVEELFSN